jgi:acetyltransferase
LGFPVALKIDSPDIAHKSEVGGVVLDVADAGVVRAQYNRLLAQVGEARPGARVHGVLVEAMCRKPHGRELIVGAFRDPVFGPVLSFGLGGVAVEVLRDRGVALPPLNPLLAGRLIDKTRAATLLGTYRQFPPVDRDRLESVLLAVSEMVCELPHLLELEINPLIADEQGVIAVDARVSVQRPQPGHAPYRHMAIHPYPSQLISTFQLPDGTNITLRPIRPEDAKIEAEFVKTLSVEAKYMRFMAALKQLTPQMLARLTQIDYDREMAFIATVKQGDTELEIGVARYFSNPDGESCEFALVVADAWQKRGIGSRLMDRLMRVAAARGLRTMVGVVLARNPSMLALMKNLGFSSSPSDDPDLVEVTRELR